MADARFAEQAKQFLAWRKAQKRTSARVASSAEFQARMAELAALRKREKLEAHGLARQKVNARLGLVGRFEMGRIMR